MVATGGLGSAAGVPRPLPTLVALAGYGGACRCLSLAIRTIRLGIAHAVWSGVGTVGIAHAVWSGWSPIGSGWTPRRSPASP